MFIFALFLSFQIAHYDTRLANTAIPHAGILSCAMINKMSQLIRVSFFACLAGALLLGMGPVRALGFGPVNPQATLGEPLNIVVPLRMDSGEQITDDCLAADVFFGDNKLASDAVIVSLTKGDKGSKGEQNIRVQTRQRIEEPVFTVYLVAGCQVRMTRKLVGFADPPDIRTALPEVRLAASPSAPSATTSGIAPVLGGSAIRLVPVGDAAKSVATQKRVASAPAAAKNGDKPPSSADRPSPRISKTAAVAKSQAKPAQKTALGSSGLSSKLDVRAPQQESGARLEIDPAVADAMVEPSLALSLNMGLPVESLDSPQVRERRQAAAALWAAMNASPEQLAKDRVRMQELESRLARLQQDAVAATKQLQEMEVRVNDAEQRRFMHPFVYALVGACLLLLAALAWLFLRHRERQDDTKNQWWDGSGHEASKADAHQEAASQAPLIHWAAEHSNATGDESTEPGALWTTPSAVGDKPQVAVSLEEPVLAKINLASMPNSGLETTQAINLLAREPVREMTVEELIDLEQQAEFFVVLGQDGAAIDLLEGHIQTGAGASPLPCLKLLEIYKRLDRRDDYERVQKVFNERFNGYAPTWDANLQHGLRLEDYPGVVERIQALWAQPKKSMGLLQQSILRPNDSTESFELPAYRELLMLYSIVRDLSENKASAQEVLSVDGLPASAEVSESDNPDAIISPLVATRPLKVEPTAAAAVAVDLTLDDVKAPTTHLDHDEPLEFVVDPEPTADTEKKAD